MTFFWKHPPASLRVAGFLAFLGSIVPAFAQNAVDVTVTATPPTLAPGGMVKVKVFAQIEASFEPQSDRIVTWYVDVLNSNGSVAVADYANTLIMPASDDPMGTGTTASTGTNSGANRVGIYNTFIDDENNPNAAGAGDGSPIKLLEFDVNVPVEGTATFSVRAGTTVTNLSDDFLVLPAAPGPPFKGGNYGAASATITVQGPNQAPTATDNANMALEDGAPAAGNVITDDDGNGVDSDPNPLNVLAITGITGINVVTDPGTDVAGTYGSLNWGTDGSYAYTLTNPVVQALTVGETLTDEIPFVYTLSDGASPTPATDTATLTITISGANDLPAATANTNSITEGSVDPVTGNVLTDDNGLGVDSDPDTTDNGNLMVNDIDGVTNQNTDIPGDYGTLDWGSDGSYVYTLDNGNPLVAGLDDGEMLTEIFNYTVKDGHIGGFATSTLTITITGINDAPVANPDVNEVTELEGTSDAVSNAVTGNVIMPPMGSGDVQDTDPNGDVLTVTAVAGMLPGTVDGATQGKYGILTLNSNGGYTYELDDGNVDVNALVAGAQLTDEIFNYTVSDGGLTDATTVTIAITGVNDNPMATADAKSITEGELVTPLDNVLGNDSDPESATLTVTQMGLETNPAVDATNPFPNDYGTLDWEADGSYTYALNNENAMVNALGGGQSLQDQFIYFVDDGNGGTDMAILTITIDGENDAPSPVPDTNQVTELVGTVDTPDNNTSGNVLQDLAHGAGFGDFADLDPEGDLLTVTEVNGDSLKVGVPVAGANGTLTLGSNGDYTYELDDSSPAVNSLGAGGSLPEGFTYTVSDGSLSAGTTLVITIKGINDPPDATDNQKLITEGDVAPAVGNLVTADEGFGVDDDPDAGDPLTVSDIDGVTNPGTDIVGAYGSLDWETDGSYSYTLDNGNAMVLELFFGKSLTDTFAYTVDDGNGGSDVATLTVIIRGVGKPPGHYFCTTVTELNDDDVLIQFEPTALGFVYRMETGIDLQNWTVLQTVEGDGNPIDHLGAGALGEERRFYRFVISLSGE